MKRIFAFCALILASLGLFALPASAQAAYNYTSGHIFNGNGCRITWHQHNNGSGLIQAYETGIWGPGIPYCWVQMKVSYWNIYGTWIINDSGWIGYPPASTQFDGQQAIWWVDYNTNNGGSIYGFRVYAPGCNAGGC